MSRKVLKDFTFSNGVKLPAGSVVSAHQWAVHQDPKYYSQPEVFDPDRFLEMDTTADGANGMDGDSGEKAAKASAGQKEVRKTMYTTSKTYLPFGHGRHAW
jgi:cytochrome P450